MRQFIVSVVAAAALVIGLESVAIAQVIPVDRGTVVRIDPQSSVVILDDGRMYRTTPSTVLLVDNRPTALTTLRAGESVVIQAGEPVAFRDGRYVALAAPAAPVVVTQAPAVVTPVPAGIKQTIYGTITDVDRDGKVRIKTDRDEFEARISQDAARRIRKGDTVTIDMTVSPPGTPAALPR